MPKPEKPFEFLYKFTWPGGATKEFRVRLDAVTLDLLTPRRAAYPTWTRLSHEQCPNCPLKEAEHPRCPVAANLIEPVEAFKDSISVEEADIEIVTETRTCKKRGPVTEGIRSLIGIYMVTSGCPILDKLKPMVRTHLPFATMRETFYRAVSAYLLGQFFVQKKGGKPDWELKRLETMYEDVNTVNKSFCRRLWSTEMKDATLNAVVQLATFADRARSSRGGRLLDEIERLFHAYFEET